MLAGEQGLEPQLPDPESGVLPLNYSPKQFSAVSRLMTLLTAYQLLLVPKGRFELPRGHPHYALNVARLPVPPLRHIVNS